MRHPSASVGVRFCVVLFVSSLFAETIRFGFVVVVVVVVSCGGVAGVAGVPGVADGQ